MTTSNLSTQQLIDLVLDQIVNDLEGSDMTALEELLKSVPRDNLIAYLPEEIANA
jgi:hypothetical protein